MGFTYNPASQIVTNTRSNDLFSYTGHANDSVTDTHNGRNEVTATDGATVSYDARHNIRAIGTTTYAYNSENMLVSGGGITLAYDPLMRLYQASSTRWAYDGATMIAEYNSSGSLLRRADAAGAGAAVGQGAVKPCARLRRRRRKQTGPLTARRAALACRNEIADSPSQRR